MVFAHLHCMLRLPINYFHILKMVLGMTLLNAPNTLDYIN